MTQTPRYSVPLLMGTVLISVVCAAANGAVTLLGVQYQQDDWLPEFNCI